MIGQEETMCNPMAQAGICNDAETDLNMMMGLCVGHDSLFLKNSRAYTTVFAVKDRALGHKIVIIGDDAAGMSAAGQIKKEY